MTPTVWLKPGILILYGASLDAATHKHHALQVIWPTTNARCTLESEVLSGPLIIDSQVPHQLQMDAGWVLLVEPRSDLGCQLITRLGDRPALSIASTAPFPQGQPHADDDPDSHLSPLCEALGITLSFASIHSDVSDRRIQQLLRQLHDCLPGGCLKPASWRATDVAASLCLSESRFLHLFREQMGIAWRPFLLWHRMICAINTIITGSPITEAAHAAGFSDGAHLSRTFRKLFGMSVRDSLALFPPT